MAGRGPAGKDPDRRIGHGNGLPMDEVSSAPFPDRVLPLDLLDSNEPWHPATLRWWRTWCESPLTQAWGPTDWAELEVCAVLHQDYMAKRSFTLAAELRLRMAKFGATPEDRLRLKVKLAPEPVKAATGTPRGVTDIKSRRSRLSDAG